MKAALIRTGSAPVRHSTIQGPSKFFIGDHDSVTGILFSGKKSTLHLEIKERKKDISSIIRRTRSEADVIQSVVKVPCRLLKSGSRSFPARITEEEEDDMFDNEEEGGGGMLVLKKKGFNLDNFNQMTGIWRESSLLEEEEIDLSGGGIGNGNNVGGGNGGGGGDSGGDADQRNMCDYYETLLKSNPENSLILRNYGKYLHEVKGDFIKAEECYSRAILATPGDGELLSMYGKLIWESYKDGERAESYFDQAVQAAPDDCYVMGSYANFLWSAEEDQEDKTEIKLRSPAPLIEAC